MKDDLVQQHVEKIKDEVRKIYIGAGDHIGDAHAILIHQLSELYLDIKTN